MKRAGSMIRKTISAMTAVAIAASVNISGVFAADTTYSVSNDTIVLKTQDAAFSAADSVSIDVKTAAEGFHDYVLEQANVQPFTTRMYGKHGVSVEISVKDSAGEALAYKGNLEVSYKIPDSWDQSHGIAVAYLTTGYIGTLKLMSYSAISSVEIKDGYAVFTMPFNSETSEDQTKLLIQEDVVAADVNALSDGVYQVGISMFKDLQTKAISMAVNTMNSDAMYIVDGDKRYLKLHFNKGVVLNLPAFLNKIYAVDGEDSNKILTPGICRKARRFLQF